jgi:hypothetical protein
MRTLLLSLALLGFLTACNLTTTTPPARDIVAGLTATAAATNATATGQAAAAATQAPLPSETIAPSQPTGGEELPAGLNPLTGLVVADLSLLDRRPVAVKISNYPRSVRPQWGLSLADIVYEYYINNDLTRFYAIFYGQNASLAGPIRSGRLFDGYLTDLYKDVFVFASADQRVLDALYDGRPRWQLIALLDGPECPPNPVCRYSPDEENFLLADTAAVTAYAERNGGAEGRPNLNGMAFSGFLPPGGVDATRIFNYYSYSAYSYWDFDPVSKRYLRYQDTQENLGTRPEDYHALVDRLTNQQVAADNVVVLFIPHFHRAYSPATDTSPAIEIVDMEFEGTGLAYGFRDGFSYELAWSHEEGGPLYLMYPDGSPYEFKPGTTWFQVHNEDSRFTADAGAWRFEFVFRRP